MVDRKKYPTDVNKMVAPRYVVDNALERGVYTPLIGNPNASKTAISLEIGPRVTNGTAPGSLVGIPSNVIYLAGEGAWLKSIGPRFKAADGDWDRFEFRNEVIPIPSELPRLERLIKRYDARLLFLDTVRYFFE